MSPAKTTSSPARIQFLAGLILFLLVTAFFAGLDLLTRNQALAAWLDRQDEASCRQTRKALIHQGYWQSMDELWIYDQLPRLDVSKGGVYLLGASEIQTATRLWELPAPLQGLIHNFAVSDSNPKAELVELRYLIEQCGILQAGPEKTLIVLGINFPCTRLPAQSLPPAFTDNWVRHGFYTCDPQQGIHPVAVNSLSKWLDIEVIHQGQLLNRLRSVAVRWVSRWRHHGVEPMRAHDPVFYEEFQRKELGPEWRRKIADCAQSFGDTLDYLVARHVQVRIVLVPDGSWFDQLPSAGEFRHQVGALCARKGVAVSDWSKMLGDNEFSDGVHPNIFGMDKLQPAFLDLALPFLRSVHALH